MSEPRAGTTGQAGPETQDTAARAAGLEGSVARLLRVGTYTAIGLIVVGVALMLATGRSPLDLAPALAPERLFDDLIRLQPAGFLWLGMIVLLLTPAARVALGGIGYARAGDRPMALIAALVLVVITTGVVLGIQGA
ncbi:MAG: DUF1634 domain-containing protein [Chloroflexi bacterium]|nr:DUF1634 domain-containing protein [Chloroflexota bacterium]